MTRRFLVLTALAAMLVPTAPAAESNAGDVQALTATIDRLVAEKWAEAKVQPAPVADDAEFLRRVSLDLVGKVPTVAETRAFLDDPASDKRAKLVERLLNGPGYVNHFTNVWRGVLIPEAENDNEGPARFLKPDFEAWLRQQIKGNVGFDALTRELLSTPLTGRNNARQFNVFDRGNKPSPAAFILAKDAKPENLAAGAARTFLGIRIECAQCHDHPFARWKREQFWGLAAFFGGVEKPGPADNVFGPLREVTDRRELAIPGTERVVQASFLDGREPEWKYKVGSRVTLAEWVTAADNPFFAKATVNRLWAHFFGVGIVDPVDDMDDKPASHPELLDELARQFVKQGHDVKFLIRALTASRAYQLASDATGAETSSAPDAHLFARMNVKGLSGEQLYDSLARATGLETPPRNLNPFLDQNGPRGEFLQKFSRRDEKPTEVQTSILQALALMNGQLVAEATDADKGKLLGAVIDAPFLDTPGRIEAMYLAALSRKPRPDESARLVEYVTKGGPSGDKKKALADVFWTLLNSGEFLFNH